MIERKIEKSKILLKNGTTIDVTIMSGIVVDDLLIQGMKAEGYRVISKKDCFPTIGRDLKNYLIRIGVLT
jgi:hypothetical protein